MNSLIFFSTLYTFICCSYCFTTLPSFIKVCSRSDPKFNECALKNGVEAIPYIVKGDPTYRIPSFNPFKVDKISLDASENVKLYGTNISIVGLNLVTLKDINWDFDEKQITLNLFTPLIRVLGTYNMNGHILVLNLKGSGAMNNSHYDNDLEVKVKYSLHTRNGIEYLKLENLYLNFVMKSVNFYFENILNNPTLSKQINKVINENSKVLMAELFVSIKKIIKDVMINIINPIADKIPFNNLFAP